MKNFKGFLKFFFLIILSTYTFVFFSVNAGYYEYKNYSHKRLTEMQIKQFEQSNIAKNNSWNPIVKNKHCSIFNRK